jgi:hypothetical protein
MLLLAEYLVQLGNPVLRLVGDPRAERVCEGLDWRIITGEMLTIVIEETRLTSVNSVKAQRPVAADCYLSYV